MKPFRRQICAALLCLVLPGAAAALEAVTLTAEGADAALAEKLLQASLVVALHGEGITDSQELLAAARADYERLIAVLYDAGRFGGVINVLIDGREAATIAALSPPERIDTIAVNVAPGPVYSFAKAKIAPLAPGTALPEGFASGRPALTATLRAATATAIESWRAAGRATAAIGAQSLAVNHADDTLAADIDIWPGPVTVFGALIPKGHVRVRPERIVEIAGLPTGETFHPDEVDRATTRLRRTGAFGSVAVTEAEALGPGNTLDVTAEVAEAKPRRVGFGAEVSSVDGVTLSGFWLHRNLFGGAERFRIEGEAAQLGAAGGGEDYRLELQYGRPATLGPDTDLYATALLEQLNEPSFASQTGEVEAGLRRIVTPDLTAQAGLGLRFSRITDAAGTNSFRFVTLPLQLTYDRRDDALDPRAGVYADVALTPFVGLTGTDSGARLTFDGRVYRGVGERLVLAGRLQGGSVIGASAARVPDDFLFFSGGGGTVRGHAYQSLGVPVLGVETGGRSFLGVQAEARLGVSDKIGLVAFYDWGAVGADATPGGGRNHAGAGLGLRYATPVGPVRLDVATPVSGPGRPGDVKFYLGIGQTF